MKKKNIIVLIITLALFIAIIGLNLFIKVNPEKVFYNFAKSHNYYNFTIVKKVEINDNEKIFFKKDINNQLSAVILKKNYFNIWNVVTEVGNVDMNKNSDNNIVWGKVNYDKKCEVGLYIGYINNTGNDKIKKIFINENETNFFTMKDGYTWYFLGEYKGSDIKIEKINIPN